MAEKTGCVELFNFDRVLWDKRSRQRICQTSFQGWTLAWCSQQSLFLVNTKDVEASAHVSLEAIRGEITAVSCRSSGERLFLAVLTKTSLCALVVSSRGGGRPTVQSVTQLEGQTQQIRDLLDVTYHSEKQLILTWSKCSLHIWSETADSCWKQRDLDIQLREGVRACCWLPLDGDRLSLLIAAGETIQLATLDPATLEISTASSIQLPGPVRRLVTHGNQSWFVAACDAPLLKTLISPPESEFLIAEAAPAGKLQSTNTPTTNGSPSTANVSHCTACVVVMATDERGSPTVLTTAPVPDIITPDLVAITPSSHILVSASMSAHVSVFHGRENARLVTHVNLESCGVGHLLEIFPDSLSTGSATCNALIKHNDAKTVGSEDTTCQPFLCLQPKHLCTVKLVQIDFSSIQPKNEDEKGINNQMKVKNEPSELSSGTVLGAEGGICELPSGDDEPEELVALGTSELHLSGLVIPSPALRCAWNPVPELMEVARAGVVGGDPEGKMAHIGLSHLWEEGSGGAVDLTELVSAGGRMRLGVEGERGKQAEEAVGGEGIVAGVGGRKHQSENRVRSVDQHGSGGGGGSALSTEGGEIRQHPTMDSADVLDVALSQLGPSPHPRRTLSFLLCRGMLHLPTVKRAFGLPEETLLTAHLGDKDVILVQDGQGFLPVTFNSKEVLKLSIMDSHEHL